MSHAFPINVVETLMFLFVGIRKMGVLATLILDWHIALRPAPAMI